MSMSEAGFAPDRDADVMRSWPLRVCDVDVRVGDGVTAMLCFERFVRVGTMVCCSRHALSGLDAGGLFVGFDCIESCSYFSAVVEKIWFTARCTNLDNSIAAPPKRVHHNPTLQGTRYTTYTRCTHCCSSYRRYRGCTV